MRPNSSVSCANSSSQPPCLTFNEYAQQVEQYFVNDTTFLFLPGTHQLDIQLNLEGLSNLAFGSIDDPGDQNAQILFSPSANITWTNCENIEISGLNFILSGQFSVLVQFDILGVYSSEFVFQGTIASFTNLTLTGDGTRVFAYCGNSSDVQIGGLIAAGTRTMILYATNGIVDLEFYGNNVFTDNLANTSDAEYMIFLYACQYTFNGNTSFIKNTAAIAIYVIGIRDSDTPVIIGNIPGNVSYINNNFAVAMYVAADPDGIENNISGNLAFINNTFTDGGE